MNSNFSFDSLSPEHLKHLTYALVSKWLATSQKDALSIFSNFEAFLRYEQIQLPKWINSLDSEEVNICLKVSLKEINESDGYHPKKWLEELCTKLEGQTKQSLPPALLTKGFVLMLVILAVRSKAVQKDKADFYQGIPSDLSTIIYKSSNLLRRDLYTPV